MQIGRTGLFDSLMRGKLIIAFFLALTCMAHRGQADRRNTLRQAGRLTAIGLALYFSSFVIFARLGSLIATSFWYITVTTAGWLLMLVGGIRIKRFLLIPRTSGDPFGKAKAGFPQQERPISSEFSFNFRGNYLLEGRQRQSWINLINPLHEASSSLVPRAPENLALSSNPCFVSVWRKGIPCSYTTSNTTR